MYNKPNTVKFGEHLVFDAYGCPFKVLNDKDLVIKVLNDLVKITQMHKLQEEPLVLSAGSNEALGGKDPGGYSGFIIIQESHISVHTFAKRGFVTVDIYSCKEFNAEPAVQYLNEIFKPKDADILKFERGMKYPEKNIY